MYDHVMTSIWDIVSTHKASSTPSSCRRIDSEIVQQYSVEPGGKARRGKKRAMAEEGDADADPKMAGALDAETFNPVTCAACDCSVGVRSMADGTYHFVDVFASNS